MAARDLRTRLLRRAARAGIALTESVAEPLTAYFELLDRWNRKINLTSLDDPDAAIDRLLLEPLIAARQLPTGPFRFMDVGSGGGSPALPLRIAAPESDLVMVESKSRKAAFLREAVRHLQLNRAVVEAVRFEELLTRPEFHERFDLITLRAVRVETRTLFNLQAFLKIGGRLFLFRGPTGPDEPAVLPPLRFSSTSPLLEPLRSRLTILEKAR